MTAATKPPAVHTCVDCAALPVELAPRKPRPAPHGGPRSRRCATHKRGHQAAQREQKRTSGRLARFGLSAAEQQELWEFQGCACPCGRKAAPTPPPGVHLDHNHDEAREHDHPEDRGCPDCVTGYLCSQCNREIVGRLTRHWSRERVATALHRVADHLTDPPWRRLRRARQEKGSTAA